MQMEMKKKEVREKEEKKKENSLNACKFSKTKLPMFVITKFDGAYFDWFRLWNQSESQIYKCDLPQVSKFSYLKELVTPKVHLLINSLPFKSQGYTIKKNPYD